MRSKKEYEYGSTFSTTTGGGTNSRARLAAICGTEEFGKGLTEQSPLAGPYSTMKILVLNSGSSSQKSSLYEIGEAFPEDPPVPLWEGKIEWSGEVAQAEVKNSRGVMQKDNVKVSSRERAVEHLLRTLWNGKTQAIASPAE